MNEGFSFSSYIYYQATYKFMRWDACSYCVYLEYVKLNDAYC